MKKVLIRTYVCTCLLGSSLALADSTNEMIAIAESAAPKVVTANATIKAQNGTVLRKGSNSYTCYPQQKVIEPMCNEATRDELISSMRENKYFKANKYSVSYKLAGEGTGPGISNSDPYAKNLEKSNDWVKEGPHLMIAVPDNSLLEGLSTDPSDPVYVVRKDTPYAHYGQNWR